MSPAEVLLKAADKVQFEGWTQFAYAVGTDGKTLAADSPNAVKWCARGALKATAATRHEYEKAADALLTHPSVAPFSGIMLWNDVKGRTAGEVADTMRRVAKELENGVQ